MKTLLDESDGYRSTAMATLRSGYRQLAGQFTAGPGSDLLDRLALVPDASDVLVPNLAERIALNARTIRDAGAQSVALLRGTTPSGADGFLTQLRSLVQRTAPTAVSEATRRWVA